LKVSDEISFNGIGRSPVCEVIAARKAEDSAKVGAIIDWLEAGLDSSEWHSIRRTPSFNTRPEFIEAMAAVVTDAIR